MFEEVASQAAGGNIAMCDYHAMGIGLEKRGTLEPYLAQLRASAIKV